MAGSKRERELHQAKLARQKREAAEAAERRKKRLQVGGAVAGVLIVIVAIAGFAIASGDSDDTPAAAASAGATPAATGTSKATGSASAVTCQPVNDKEPKTTQYDKVDNTLIPNGTYTEALTTNCGEIVLALDAKGAPKTTAAMTFLSDRGFYDNTQCHRLTTQGIYVLQCGDPAGNGTGGPGFQIPDENLPKAGADGTAVYERGTVAMANAGSGTTGSQFFLVYQDSPLPPNYTVLGTISKGLEIVDYVAAQGTANGSADGPPKQPLQIVKMISSVSYPAGQ